jgi:ribose/xylose/arabinose/galactoside ABC-type transport system permease subunit
MAAREEQNVERFGTDAGRGHAPVSVSEKAVRRLPGRQERLAGQLRRGSLGAALKLIQLGPLLVLAVLWLGLSLLTPYFLTTLNLTNLLQASAVVAILAVGQLLIVLTGAIDLSAAAVLALTTIVGARVSQSAGGNAALVIFTMLLIGCAIGVLNGLLVEKLRLGSPFVVTLGMLSVASGAAYVVSGGATITGLPSLVTDLGSGTTGVIPLSALVVVGFAGLAWILTTRLRFGRWIYLVGGNRDGASRVGVPVGRVSIAVFAIGGTAAGLAGVIQAGLTNSGAPAAGFNALLDAISAVVIGGAALAGGRGTVVGALIGALILGTVHNGLNLLSVDTSWEPIVLGLVLISALAMDRTRERVETRLRLVETRRAGGVDDAADSFRARTGEGTP